MSEACTLSLWLGAILLLSPLSGEAHSASAHYGKVVHAPLTHSVATEIMNGGARQTAALIASAGAPHILARDLGRAFHHAIFASSFAHAANGLTGFAGAILAFAALLWVWKSLSGGQNSKRAANIDYARHFEISALAWNAALQTQICTVHHSDDGRIEMITTSEDVLPAAETGMLIPFEAPALTVKQAHTTIAA